MMGWVRGTSPRQQIDSKLHCALPKYCAPEFRKPRKSIFDRQHGIAGERSNFARETAGPVDDQKLRFA
jgi:hypothetical protein